MFIFAQVCDCNTFPKCLSFRFRALHSQHGKSAGAFRIDNVLAQCYLVEMEKKPHHFVVTIIPAIFIVAG
tara:strand:+ start:41353 stop:41562 length:210 start_codon:yes stop_codon:yes gene_type:complete